MGLRAAKNIKVLEMLDKRDLRELFKIVAESRKIRFDELVDRAKSRDLQFDKLQPGLVELENAGLIKTIQAPIPDLRIYYISQEGLAAERSLLNYF